MHCSKAANYIQLYIDKRLPIAKLRVLEVHLSECSACRQYLHYMETIEQSFSSLDQVIEPENLTHNIMHRVALSERQAELARQEAQIDANFVPLRPSFSEILVVLFLATFVTISFFLGQPTLRASLPIANGHDELSLLLINSWNSLLNLNDSTLMLIFWVGGTILGIWITLLVAGSEMRTIWFKAVQDRLPVW